MSACSLGSTQMVNGIPLRLYSENECNSLGGSWAANGECGKPNGAGSYSWDCRETPNSLISSAATALSGGGARGIPSWALYAGGAGAVLLAWKMLRK